MIDRMATLHAAGSYWLICYWGVFVTREHVRHNKSGITHRGKTRISH
jgi:hypothetical protein